MLVGWLGGDRGVGWRGARVGPKKGALVDARARDKSSADRTPGCQRTVNGVVERLARAPAVGVVVVHGVAAGSARCPLARARSIGPSILESSVRKRERRSPRPLSPPLSHKGERRARSAQREGSNQEDCAARPRACGLEYRARVRKRQRERWRARWRAQGRGRRGGRRAQRTRASFGDQEEFRVGECFVWG